MNPKSRISNLKSQIGPLAPLLAILISAAASAATNKPPRPTTAIDQKSCVTAECHAEVKQYKKLHGPVNANTCDACHELTDAKAHTFAQTRQKAELCTYCHEFDTSKMTVLHKPVTLGECTGCHDPHGGNTRGLVKGDTSAQLCARCHDSVTDNRKYVHTPVAAAECDSCHLPHGSQFPKLVNAAGDNLCFSCHFDFGMQLANSRFIHQAMDKGCAQCHDVHASSQPMELLKPTTDLCTNSCHEKVRDDAASKPYKHTVVTTDRACMTCHTPHGGDLAGLMADQPSRICMECHDKPAKAEGGRIIAAASEVTNPKLTKHGPIRDGQCNGCHTPHGGDQPLFLPKSYTTSFYLPFTMDNYQLCFTCHSRQLVASEQTADATNFRNGARNLHYVHVMSERGRNCRVCHANHAAGNDRGIRDSASFGRWNIPISFTRSATGGTCDTGCHANYGYDRKNPLPPPTTQPTTRRSPVVVFASSDDPAPVQFTARDTLSETIIIPAASRPTVMLFVRSQEPAIADNVAKLLARGAPDATAAQIILLFCGGEPDPKLSATARNHNWRIVADPEDLAARKLGVYSWPSTLIIHSDGARLAHLTGSPESLPAQIAAYLEFAAGRIDRPALDQRLAKFDVVVDDPAKRAARHLQLAQSLLDDGKPDNARRVLADALRIQPNSAPAKAAMVDCLLQLRQTQDALTLLNTIPAAAIPAWQSDLLKAKVALATNKPADARTLLARVVKAKPDLPEPHYLLAQAYERNQEWQKAAAEYKAYAEAKRK